MYSKQNERRKFIKLASGLLVTPFASLKSGNVFSASTKSPLRLLTIVDTYGLPRATRNEIWVKSTAGDYALKTSDLGTILSPLKAYKDNMLLVSGLNADSLNETGDSRSHQSLNTHTLTGSRKTSGTGASVQIQHASIDVHIGNYLNNDQGLARAFPHLYFTNGQKANFETYCHDAAGIQIRSLSGAKAQASSIFTSGADIAGLEFANSTQQGVFALVQKQIQALRGQLTNANTSTVLDAYKSSVDGLAAQLQISSQNGCGAQESIDNLPDKTVVSSPASTPYIFNNIQQAFACDLTSSLTYNIGNELGNNMSHAEFYDEELHADEEILKLLDDNMHSMSHRVDDAANKSHELVRIHHAEEISRLLDSLSTTLDVDGNTILDNTVVSWISSMSHNAHKTEDYCHLLIAGKNANLKGGYHYDCADSTNNDLLTTIAQGMYMPDDQFGGHDQNGLYLPQLQKGPISKMLKS